MGDWIAPRIVCKDGMSLSVQASQYHYCTPREDNAEPYLEKEVGYIRDVDGTSIAPPIEWTLYADGEFPSSVYGYVPVELIEEFIKKHGGIQKEALP